MDPNSTQNNQPPAPTNPSPIPSDGNDPSQPVMPPANLSPTPQGGGKKKMVIIIVVVLVILAVAGALAFAMMGKDDEKDATPAPTTSTPNQEEEVPTQTDATSDSDAQSGAVAAMISNFAFSPSTLKVKKGATVTWTNNDSAAHTVTSDDDSAVSGLDSELIAQGKTFSFTFDKVGVYSYHCTPHPSMTGTVEVVE
jgi:plastocyanin